MEKFDLKKHWKGFLNNEIAVNCPTEKLAKEFLEYCDKQGIRWISGNLLTKTYWNEYKEKTHYSCGYKLMTYSNINSWHKTQTEFTGFSNESIIKQSPLKIENYNLIVHSQPNTTTWIIKSNDEIVDVQTVENNIHSFKVFVYGTNIKVILKDGSRGIAKCSPEDKFDLDKGIKIAHARAMEKYIRKELKKLVK